MAPTRGRLCRSSRWSYSGEMPRSGTDPVPLGDGTSGSIRSIFLDQSGRYCTIRYGMVEAALPTIGVIAGDGVGPEVVREGLAVLAEAAGRDGFRYELVPFDLGGERHLKSGAVLPASTLEELRGCAALCLGAVGHPGVAPGVLEKGI